MWDKLHEREINIINVCSTKYFTPMWWNISQKCETFNFFLIPTNIMIIIYHW